MSKCVQLPFYLETGEDEVTEAMLMAAQVCKLLRTSRAFWKGLVQALPPCTGSLATELLVILDASNRPFCPRVNAGTEIDVLSRGIVDELTRQGVSALPSRRMAAAVISHVVANNARTVAACHTLAIHSKDAKFILRVALKSVKQVSINPSTNTVWFRNGHANLAVLDSAAKLLLIVEPTGTEVIRKLDGLLSLTIIPEPVRRLFRIIHNFHMFTRQAALANDDDMCTAWCAITAMLILANDVDGPESFWALAKWVQTRRPQLLRQFFVYACRVLKNKVPVQ